MAKIPGKLTIKPNEKQTSPLTREMIDAIRDMNPDLENLIIISVPKLHEVLSKPGNEMPGVAVAAYKPCACLYTVVALTLEQRAADFAGQDHDAPVPEQNAPAPDTKQ